MKGTLVIPRILLFTGAALCLLVGPVCAQATRGAHTLIVHLSTTNNTKAIAEMIQQNIGGKIVALKNS